MSNLYGNKLAGVYDTIYQGFIDYKLEYLFYKKLCQKYGSSTILEIACGTGNLAAQFARDFKSYVGLDYSKAMLAIAKEKFPQGEFVQGDMRTLRSAKTFNTILITGRSTSYLLCNKDLIQTFSSVHQCLTPNGVFIFDFIDANLFVPYVEEHKYVTHHSTFGGVHFKRKSKWTIKSKTPYKLINWTAEYYQKQEKELQLLGKDRSVFRVFTENEVKKQLLKANFSLLDSFQRNTYAFQTKVFICGKTHVNK